MWNCCTCWWILKCLFSFCLALPVISKCMELSMGSGNDRKLKGSKRALMWPQVLHFTWDLSCPWKRSTTIERFLRKWFSQACERETHRCPQSEKKKTFHQCVHIGSFKSAELMYWAWQGLKTGVLTLTSVATSWSGRPSLSLSSTYGFSCTRFKSSWSPSKRNAKSSWESCCWKPLNLGAYFAIVHYKNVF